MKNRERRPEGITIKLSDNERRALTQLIQTELGNTGLTDQYRKMLQELHNQLDRSSKISIDPEAAKAIAHLVNEKLRIIQDADHQKAYEGIKSKLQISI